jgi:hypothetical protein
MLTTLLAAALAQPADATVTRDGSHAAVGGTVIRVYAARPAAYDIKGAIPDGRERHTRVLPGNTCLVLMAGDRAV